ncbi:MAG: Na+/H+ antiporter subunit E [Nitrospirota bacterium]|nr:MAG: Na+/H+ antiporter subunit E [Nitrospirota bacterium]
MHFIYMFLIMFGFWIVLSGKFDAFHITLGVISCLIVSFLSLDLFFHETKKKGRIAEVVRFLSYIPWLVKEIVLATIHVAFIALRPNVKDNIDPKVIMFKTRLKKDLSKVTFANSITLTPGTITIKVSDDEFYVHALTKKTAEGLPGEMEERVGKVFKEFGE